MTSDINDGEREELRRKIEDEMYAEATPAREGRAFLVIGRPGVGKSSTRTRHHETEQRALAIDPDRVKPRIPEFSENGISYPAPVHRESSRIAASLFRRAVANKDNIVVETEGDDVERIKRIVTLLKEAGYEVHLELVTAPAALAAERLVKQVFETGVFWDPTVALGIGAAPEGSRELDVSAFETELIKALEALR